MFRSPQCFFYLKLSLLYNRIPIRVHPFSSPDSLSGLLLKLHWALTENGKGVVVPHEILPARFYAFILCCCNHLVLFRRGGCFPSSFGQVFYRNLQAPSRVFFTSQVQGCANNGCHSPFQVNYTACWTSFLGYFNINRSAHVKRVSSSSWPYDPGLVETRFFIACVSNSLASWERTFEAVSCACLADGLTQRKEWSPIWD